MDGAGVGSAFGLFVFEAVKFTEYLDGDEEVIVLKEVQAMRVVQQHIGIEDEIFHQPGRFRSIAF